MHLEALERLKREFAKMPGIGEKSAERLAFHILKISTEDALKLANAIRDVKTKLRYCTVCFNLAEDELCNICKDARREKNIICVVEQPKDVTAFERTGTYKGVYHVLHGHIAPLEGIHPDSLSIDALLQRVRSISPSEVILATNPTIEGDATAHYIADRLRQFGVKVTRIARGLPQGSFIEFASTEGIADALEGRREMGKR